MANALTCPSGQTEIEIAEVMRPYLAAQIRTELEENAPAKQAELEAAKSQLEHRARQQARLRYPAAQPLRTQNIPFLHRKATHVVSGDLQA